MENKIRKRIINHFNPTLISNKAPPVKLFQEGSNSTMLCIILLTPLFFYHKAHIANLATVLLHADTKNNCYTLEDIM
jgi:hypothetical protein